MIRSRVQLLELLGSKCKQCGESDIETLQIDHINDDGAEDRRRFRTFEAMYVYYLNRPEEANNRLQVLCGNHNWKKRYAIHIDEKLKELQKQEELEKQKPNKFFDWEEIDGTNTPLFKEDHSWESPSFIGCPNCHTSDWSIMVAHRLQNTIDPDSEDIKFIKEEKQHYYFVCKQCKFDLLSDTLATRKPPHIQTAEADYYQSLHKETSS